MIEPASFDHCPDPLAAMKASYLESRRRMEKPRPKPVAKPAVVLPASPEPAPIAGFIIPKQQEWLFQTITTAPAWNTRASAEQIVADIAGKHGVTVEQINGPDRFSKIVKARHEAIAVVFLTFRGWSLSKIGQFFGGRDHTTILNAIRRQKVTRKAI